MNETLRPFTLGEILDRTVQLYRRNFLLFAGVAAAPMGAMMAAFVPLGVLFALLVPAIHKGSEPSYALIGLLVAVAVLVAVPVCVVAGVVSQAALTRTAIGAQKGESLTVRATLGSVWPRFWRYLWLMILQGIFVVLIPGAVAAILVAVLAYLGTRAGNGSAAGAALGFLMFLVVAATVVVVIRRALVYSLALAVCVAEEKPAWDSLQRAAALSKGSRGRIFVMLLLVWALAVIASLIVGIPFLIVVGVVTWIGHGAQYAPAVLIVAQVLRILVDFAVQILIAPVYAMALVLFYYDQRIRTEGYDIERMMEAAGLTKFASPPEIVSAGLPSGIAADPATVEE